eukprot:scaffold4606_cov107-Isochrysis_galbana.AAC.2
MAANPLSQPLPAAWLDWPGAPSRLATDEVIVKISPSPTAALARCRAAAPCTLGPYTVRSVRPIAERAAAGMQCKPGRRPYQPLSLAGVGDVTAYYAHVAHYHRVARAHLCEQPLPVHQAAHPGARGQHARREQPEPAKPTGDHPGLGSRSIHGRARRAARRLQCGWRLRHQDSLIGQPVAAISRATAAEATRFEGLVPLRHAQQRAAIVLARSIGFEHPPAVSHAEYDLHKREQPHRLIDDEHTSRSQQLGAVELVRAEALQPRVDVNVEQSSLNHRVFGTEPGGRLAKKQLRHVGEDVALAVGSQDREQLDRRAARPGANLEHVQLAPDGQLSRHGFGRGDRRGVVGRGEHIGLVEWPDCLERAAREEQLLVVHLSLEHVRQARADAAHLLVSGRHCWRYRRTKLHRQLVALAVSMIMIRYVRCLFRAIAVVASLPAAADPTVVAKLAFFGTLAPTLAGAHASASLGALHGARSLRRVFRNCSRLLRTPCQ